MLREFAGVPVGGIPSPQPLTAAQLKDARDWLVARGIGSYTETGQYVFVASAPVGDFVAAGAARKYGFSPEEYAQIIGIPAPAVRQFMTAPENLDRIGAYSQ